MTDPKPPEQRDEQELQPRDASPNEEAGPSSPKPPSEPDGQQAQEKWYEKTRHQILLFAGGIALFVLLGGLILDWYIAPKTSGQKKDLVQALGLITAGVAGQGDLHGRDIVLPHLGGALYVGEKKGESACWGADHYYLDVLLDSLGRTL